MSGSVFHFCHVARARPPAHRAEMVLVFPAILNDRVSLRGTL